MRREFFIRRDKLTNAIRLKRLTRQVQQIEAAQPEKSGTVVVFNASTRLGNVSLNAAYSLLTAWGLRLEGKRVIHFVCQAGMSRCLLGSSELDPDSPPPCQTCTALSDRMYAGAEVAGFAFEHDPELWGKIENLPVSELMAFTYKGLPLGELVLPSLRWRMRAHHLEDDRTTLSLYRAFILSAWQVAREFQALIETEKPELALVFNGQMFPEAVVGHLARQAGIKVLTHETGYQPFTVFMTTGDATARQVYLSEEELTLSERQNAVLDDYLEKRFQGRFSMGGIQFWGEMNALPAEVEEKLSAFSQVVPIFTNVIFDTSQAHANRAFEHMFAWLDTTLEIARTNPETLFVLRAHPDELRPNSRKKSRETVQEWVARTGADQLPNMVFIDPLQYVSSYELISRSKFILAYNSSIALEAVLLGKLPVCAGWAWYSEYPVVVSPQNPEEYHRQVEDLLAAEMVSLPEENQRTARGLVYYQNFNASLPFGRYLEPHHIRGYVRFKPFDVRQLDPQGDQTLQAILTGIHNNHPVIDIPEENYDN